ncbi:MAG TPA: chemotaxis protein CheW [Lacipirellulaceae bacterium]|nr:chemotaxis protein CheW [Lacipirellulaceae bacterium]
MSRVVTTSDYGIVAAERLHSESQVPSLQDSNQERIRTAFHERALRLAGRSRQVSNHAERAPVIVFRLGTERFGIELRNAKQVFSRVPITPVPKMRSWFVGVANLSGTMRSVVDLGALMNVPSAKPDTGYVLLVQTQSNTLAIWVEAVDEVKSVDFETLVPIDGVAWKDSAACLRGTTEDGICVLNLESLCGRLRDGERNSNLH